MSPGTTTLELPPFAALLLAGGRSSRMGRDKASLEWNGVSLLEHMSAVLRDAGATRVWRSGPFEGVDALPDRVPERGPVGGLASLAQTADDGVYLVVPVDMPRLDPALLHSLLRALAEAPLPVRAARFVEHVLPLALRLDASSRAQIVERMDAPASARSLRALHAGLSGIDVQLPATARAHLASANTPQEWQSLIHSPKDIA